MACFVELCKGSLQEDQFFSLSRLRGVINIILALTLRLLHLFQLTIAVAIITSLHAIYLMGLFQDFRQL